MPKFYPDLQYEINQHRQSRLVLGVDEVGRGPLAGPVVVAGVVFPVHHSQLQGVTDSKLLTAQQRELLAKQITQSAVGYSIVEGSVEMINKDGIISTLVTAMNTIVSKMKTQLPDEQMMVVCDGKPFVNPRFHPDMPTEWLVKADQLVYTVAAASIIAKVYRDRLMREIATQYPEYGWDRNMGYGTTEHRQAIQHHGATPYHRAQFIRNVLSTSA